MKLKEYDENKRKKVIFCYTFSKKADKFPDPAMRKKD